MDDEALEASIDEAMGLSLAENAAPYDGVTGTLPGWIPENFNSEFHAVRSRLLETHSHAELLHYIAETKAIFDPGNAMYSRPFYLTPPPIMKDVSRLAHFQEAVRVKEKVSREKERELLADGMERKKAQRKAKMEGEKAGMALLTDPEHARIAEKGRSFDQPGRGAGTIRKWITRQLKENITMKNAELWKAFKAKPLRGWRVFENHQGKYIEGPSNKDHVTYPELFIKAGESRLTL